jgi:hypothetical protein
MGEKHVVQVTSSHRVGVINPVVYVSYATPRIEYILGCDNDPSQANIYRAVRNCVPGTSVLTLLGMNFPSSSVDSEQQTLNDQIQKYMHVLIGSARCENVTFMSSVFVFSPSPSQPDSTYTALTCTLSASLAMARVAAIDLPVRIFFMQTPLNPASTFYASIRVCMPGEGWNVRTYHCEACALNSYSIASGFASCLPCPTFDTRRALQIGSRE